MTLLLPTWWAMPLTWPLGVWVACGIAAVAIGLFLAGEKAFYSLLVAVVVVLAFFALVYAGSPHPAAVGMAGR